MMMQTSGVIYNFWEWYNHRARQMDNGVREFALDKCEEAFRHRDWDGFARWYRIYRRSRHTRSSTSAQRSP